LFEGDKVCCWVNGNRAGGWTGCGVIIPAGWGTGIRVVKQIEWGQIEGESAIGDKKIEWRHGWALLRRLLFVLFGDKKGIGDWKISRERVLAGEWVSILVLEISSVGNGS
jgi:hypothetical protein